MKHVIPSLLLVAVITTPLFAQNSSNKNTNHMVTTNESTLVVRNFFTAFGNGDFTAIVNTFHDSCTITAVRKERRAVKQIYGSYEGKDGVKQFIQNLGNTFDTKAFSVEHVVGEGNVAFANGTFTHEVKSTGKLFSSDWALSCVIKDGKILEYRFYEDSEKFTIASSN